MKEVSMGTCDNTIEMALPKYLHKHQEEIRHIFDKTQGQDYGFKDWQLYFHTSPDIIQDLGIINKQCPSTISRKDVGYFAKESRFGGYDEIKRLFMTCMIWGYAGWSKSGDAEAGYYNTRNALSDDRLIETLRKSAERIINGQIEEAYEGFKLKGCKSAFFTKYFYFIGKENNVKPMPVILDSRVNKILRALGEYEGWDATVFANKKGYHQYVCSMDRWATEIGCPADNLEYFMFKCDKEGVIIE